MSLNILTGTEPLFVKSFCLNARRNCLCESINFNFKENILNLF